MEAMPCCFRVNLRIKMGGCLMLHTLCWDGGLALGTQTHKWSVMFPAGSVADCQRSRLRVHTGLPHAPLSRDFEAPPARVRDGALASAESRRTSAHRHSLGAALQGASARLI